MMNRSNFQLFITQHEVAINMTEMIRPLRWGSLRIPDPPLSFCPTCILTHEFMLLIRLLFSRHILVQTSFVSLMSSDRSPFPFSSHPIRLKTTKQPSRITPFGRWFSLNGWLTLVGTINIVKFQRNAAYYLFPKFVFKLLLFR